MRGQKYIRYQKPVCPLRVFLKALFYKPSAPRFRHHCSQKADLFKRDCAAAAAALATTESALESCIAADAQCFYGTAYKPRTAPVCLNFLRFKNHGKLR